MIGQKLLKIPTMSLKTGALSISAVVASSTFVYTQGYSLLKSICIVIIGGYLPSYFDGSEYDGTRYTSSAGKSKLAKFIWRNLLGLPQAEVRWNHEKDFNNKEQQCVFGSHSHGVFGLHHMGTMMTPINCKENESFEDLCPMTNRRELENLLHL